MELLKENEYKKSLEWITNRYELPSDFNDETIRTFVSESGSLQSIWGLCGKDISSSSFDAVNDEAFIKLAFNENTIFTHDFKFDYKRILEVSKNPGLGITELHERGINGNGINVAVIDKPILETHKELTDRIKSYVLICPENEFNETMHFHGITCAAFLCGNTCGVANGANLYYYAYPDRFEDDGMYWNYHFKALEMIKEHNESTNSDDMIKIVSISAGFPRDRIDLHDKMNDYVTKFEKIGCYIVFSNLFGEIFSCSSKSLYNDNNNPDNYKLDVWQNDWHKKKILIPAGGRTSPCNSGNDKYMYNGNQSCFSWAIPYLCGVFALAMQINKNLSYIEFLEDVKRTAYVNSKELLIINPIKIIESIRT